LYLSSAYRREVGALHEALQGASEADLARAGEAIRALVEAIVLTPGDGGLEIDVKGDLGGILAIAAQGKPPAHRAGGFQVLVGAGTRTDLNCASSLTILQRSLGSP
jgi:hypothetical protein